MASSRPPFSWRATLSSGTLWAALALLILTVAAYAQVLHCDFVNLDDPQYVSQNLNVQCGMSADGILWALTTGHASNWHPLTWVSLQYDQSLFEGHVWGFHLTNLLLHVANVLLLYALLVQLTGQWPPSALVAALFAVHPLHVESVAWIAERKDVLSTFFGLIAVLAYVRYIRLPPPRTGRKRGRDLRRIALTGAIVLLAYAASLMAKPMLVTLPALLLLLDYWPLRRTCSLGRLLIEKIPLFLLAALSCLITFDVQRHGGAVKSLTHYPMVVRLGNAVEATVAYLTQMVWPTNLAVYYPYPGSLESPFRVGVEALCLLGVTIGALIVVRSKPYLLIGWLWYLGTLVPVIGLVQVGHQARADRYTYIPLIGIFIALVWLLWEVLPPRRRVLGLAIVGLAVLPPCVVLTWRQVDCWKSSLALWEHTLAVTADNPFGRCMYGAALLDAGRKDEAEKQLQESVRIDPDMDFALELLGYLREREGRKQEALAYFQRAARAKPDSQRYKIWIERMENELAAPPSP